MTLLSGMVAPEIAAPVLYGLLALLLSSVLIRRNRGRKS